MFIYISQLLNSKNANETPDLVDLSFTERLLWGILGI